MLNALDYPETHETFRELSRSHKYPRIKSKHLNADLFPSFVISTFSVEPITECLLNVWAVRNEKENYHLAGGIRPQKIGMVGMERMRHFQSELERIVDSEDESLKALRELDNVFLNYLTDPRPISA